MHRMPDEEHRRFERARVARLATVGSDGLPHLVPVVFAMAGDAIYTAVDGKPKSTRQLRRLDNITATGRVSLLVDDYAEDWTQLWWIRVDGAASVLADGPESRTGIDALVHKYPQYTASPPAGPVVAIEPDKWASWSALDA
ncbi:TIGR03668 family PPOX class F420-dependent oxidoreductase [Rhodococcus sp. NPDC058514]|uniref:TIGR03668 family PPOX class F420-dependent oxidoreductase n=1 Tax=unclassified Rhodococcus (in: high G+C Gram-positive bacteria) TaxID=192944 RepID=UPI0036521D13